jgi:hypothetical protein
MENKFVNYVNLWREIRVLVQVKSATKFRLTSEVYANYLATSQKPDYFTNKPCIHSTVTCESQSLRLHTNAYSVHEAALSQMPLLRSLSHDIPSNKRGLNSTNAQKPVFVPSTVCKLIPNYTQIHKVLCIQQTKPYYSLLAHETT